MLRKILAISGRPGLFRLVSQAKNAIIVEDMVSGKRMPIHSRERISSLGDISIYTMEGDIPLAEVLENISKKNEGKALDLKAIDGDLRSAMAEYLPDFDTDRVHTSDMRKLFSWYNLLVGQGMTTFVEKEESAEEKAEEKAEKK